MRLLASHTSSNPPLIRRLVGALAVAAIGTASNAAISSPAFEIVLFMLSLVRRTSRVPDAGASTLAWLSTLMGGVAGRDSRRRASRIRCQKQPPDDVNCIDLRRRVAAPSSPMSEAIRAQVFRNSPSGPSNGGLIDGFKRKRAAKARFCLLCGGSGEIRTHGGVTPTAVFKTAALNHSATLP